MKSDDGLVISVYREQLCISKSKAYDFVRDAYKNGDSFRVIKIAGTYRIPKKSFNKWLQGA